MGELFSGGRAVGDQAVSFQQNLFLIAKNGRGLGAANYLFYNEWGGSR